MAETSSEQHGPSMPGSTVGSGSPRLRAWKRLWKARPAERRAFFVQFCEHIQQNYLVRLHMALMLLATILGALLTSKILLTAGLTSMAVRYPLTLLAAYFILLGLIRIWLTYLRVQEHGATPLRRRRVPWEDILSFPGPLPDGSSAAEVATSAPVEFGGGDFGGAGVSGDWAGSADGTGFDGWQGMEMSSAADAGSGASVADASSLDIPDVGNVVGLIVALILLTVGVVSAGAWLIWSAAAILPEIAFYGLAAAVISRQARRSMRAGWVGSAVRLTWKPFAVLLVVTSIAGYLLHSGCPGAVKLTDVGSCLVRGDSGN